jgi:quercetin dioxygenase-like cupin family protein
MKKFDLIEIEGFDYEQREKNVLYEKPEFKIRIINLKPGEAVPECDMSSHVIFICFKGGVELSVDGKKVELSSGQLLASEPGVFSIRAEKGSRLLGIQIKPQLAGRAQG